MQSLTDDFLLLAVRRNGRLALREKLRFGVAAGELIQLASRGSVDINDGQITILDPTPVGDPLLDDAVAMMTTESPAAVPPTIRRWIALYRPGLVGRHVAALKAAEAISEEQRKKLRLFQVTRLVIIDVQRWDRTREQLDAIASGSADIGPEQAALAGLAEAVGLAAVLYRGKARERIKEAPAAAARARVGSAEPGLTLSAIVDLMDAVRDVVRNPATYGPSSNTFGGGTGGGMSIPPGYGSVP